MSILWTFIAGYLYFEIALVIIMILPIFSPRRWNQFFKSRLFSMLREHGAMYFYCLLGILSLFLMDALREMKKYSHPSETHGPGQLGMEMKGNVKLFRAQRNFYITGFAIFLAFVIRRLVSMIIIQDELMKKADSIIKEAESTVKLAKSTVLANTIQSEENKHVDEINNQLKTTEELLKVEKLRVRELEEEASKWRLKYEEIVNSLAIEGDN